MVDQRKKIVEEWRKRNREEQETLKTMVIESE